MRTIFRLFLSLLILSVFTKGYSQVTEDTFPVKGLSIAAPDSDRLNDFVNFMNEELGPRGVNTLILRVDYNYEYKSHPELANEDALSTEEVKKLVAAGQENKIRIIPQVNLLGHQSWHTNLNNLLKVYPEFDETPHIELPDKYEWPNEDGLYCKSYCPLHPKVHDVVFDLVDEICEVFEADAFHAGMDEVFYIGNENCPRCSGRDKAELFAGEVTKIRNHLAKSDRELWIWGDRLIDGKTTGIGMWEASMNNTHRAIDMIPEDVFICDWHYERADPTPVYFAMKGFRVAACPWRDPKLARMQAQNMHSYRAQATKKMKENFTGLIQTVWTGAGNFMDEFYASDPASEENTAAACFRALFDEIEKIENTK
ncbi:family 20 glycosylhydrolase [Salegentibacter chungangensis]|uniref:Family 20 glycosylhydrolase n=1 Tax=Salegentibacter chungangensis TaxID=1335724 RepID=A0ABW3NSY7_9FLAO